MSGRYDVNDARIGLLLLGQRKQGFTLGRIRETRNNKANLDVLDELLASGALRSFPFSGGSFGLSEYGKQILDKLIEQYELAGWSKELNRIKEEYL